MSPIQTQNDLTNDQLMEMRTLVPNENVTSTAIKPMALDPPTLTALEPSPERTRDFVLLAAALSDTERFVDEEMRRSPNVMEQLRHL